MYRMGRVGLEGMVGEDEGAGDHTCLGEEKE